LLAGIAHDLRGPLTRMQLRLDQPAEEVDLALLRRDSREMAALLEQSLSLLSGGVAAEACQWLDLRALGDTLVDDLSEQHALPPERLSCHGEVPPIWARPVALRRALSNLLDNAVRHGGGGELCLAHEGSVWRIEVSDRGPGLAAELLEQVLRPYVQAPEAARGGWGLGLAVAHQVAQAHGGTLSLHAREGGGLTVRMTLPSQVCPD
jgi:signal transduction histidine kinase